MINLKQMELSLQLFDQLKQQYPEIELVDIVESGVYLDHIWVRMIMPGNEDRMIEMGELAADLSINISMDYGYHITISSASRAEKMATNVGVQSKMPNRVLNLKNDGFQGVMPILQD